MSDCIIWTKSFHRNGYGKVGVKGITKLAHRVAWEKAYGEIPKGLYICHKCDNRACVNVDHLFIGTPSDNMRDCVEKGRFIVPNRARGERVNTAKLTEDQVREIRASIGTSREIAERFGLHMRSVQNIRSKTTWKHLA